MFVFKNWCIIVLVLFLSNCSVNKRDSDNTGNTAEYYINLANEAITVDASEGYLLQAAEVAFDNNDIALAYELLFLIKSQDNVALNSKKYLLLSRIFFSQKKISEVLNTIERVDVSLLSVPYQKLYWSYLAQFYDYIIEPVNVAYALVRLQELTHEQNQELSDRIWFYLSQSLIDDVKQKNKENNKAWQGWADLFFLFNYNIIDVKELNKKLSVWQKKYAQHMAAVYLPDKLKNGLTVSHYQPRKIGIFLPLSGHFAYIGQVIQNGILFKGLQKYHDVEFVFYDTTLMSVDTLYEQALLEACDFIIGPLLISNIKKILEVYQGEVPMVVLNQPHNLDDIYNALYFFSLSPEKEAIQTAQYMVQQGVSSPIVISNDTIIGQKMANAFAKQFFMMTDMTVDIYTFENEKELNKVVDNAMKINESRNRNYQLKQIFGGRLKISDRSRQDIDAIYLVSNAKEILLLKPMIDVNISQIDNILPLYTSSLASIDVNDRKLARELDLLYFTEIPWLTKPNTLQKKITAVFPEYSKEQLRLFALGFDSIELIDKLAQMRSFGSFRYLGLSGIFNVSDKGVINRHLYWSQFQHNKVKRKS